jgi:hypothetical protein
MEYTCDLKCNRHGLIDEPNSQSADCGDHLGAWPKLELLPFATETTT